MFLFPSIPLRTIFHAVIALCLPPLALSQPSPSDSSSVAIGPVLIHAPAAEYPEQAAARRLIGGCTISMQVDVKGEPRDLKMVSCSNPLFESNSYAAAVQYRFKPARDKDGGAVPTTITVDIKFGIFDGPTPTPKISYAMLTPPGTTSTDADANGVYPLSLELIPPKITSFRDVGFGLKAFSVPEGSTCEVILIVSTDGKPRDARATRCDDSVLEQPSVTSLMGSKYKPALFRGKAVASRILVRLVYAGLADPHQGKSTIVSH